MTDAVLVDATARYLNGYQAYEQGNGLTQVGPAWDVLKTQPATPGITSHAPINTKISQIIAPLDNVSRPPLATVLHSTVPPDSTKI